MAEEVIPLGLTLGGLSRAGGEHGLDVVDVVL
jgi:hypothetical protein